MDDWSTDAFAYLLIEPDFPHFHVDIIEIFSRDLGLLTASNLVVNRHQGHVFFKWNELVGTAGVHNVRFEAETGRFSAGIVR